MSPPNPRSTLAPVVRLRHSAPAPGALSSTSPRRPARRRPLVDLAASGLGGRAQAAPVRPLPAGPSSTPRTPHAAAVLAASSPVQEWVSWWAGFDLNKAWGSC